MRVGACHCGIRGQRAGQAHAVISLSPNSAASLYATASNAKAARCVRADDKVVAEFKQT